MIQTNSSSEKLSGKKFHFQGLVYDPNKKRNVVDHLSWMSSQDIKNYIEGRKNNFSLLLVNIDYDNNTGNIIRSANAFGAKEIILYGRKKYDRRASVGVEFYTQFRQLKFISDIESVFNEFELIVGLENNIPKKTVSLPEFEWHKDKHTLICIGQEGSGLPSQVLERCHYCLEIPQVGSVRSLNVSVASGIVMYDYCLKTKGFEK